MRLFPNEPTTKTPHNLRNLVADLGFRPTAWQSEAPPECYDTSLPPVGNSQDLQRVLALPTREPFVEGSLDTQALLQITHERYSRNMPSCMCRQIAPHRECIRELRPVQAWALYELGLKRGLLGAIGVGHGKTVIDLLAPLALPGCRKAVLLVPPGLVKQLISEYELLRQHFRVPGLVSHYAKESYTARLPNVPTLHIYPYSLLSRPDATEWFSDMEPDFIIADECHKLKNFETATTTRFMRYFTSDKGRAKDVRFAGWTGSLTDSDIKDYAHLATVALRADTPLPLNQQVLDEWSQAISAKGKDFVMRPPGALLKMCEPGEHIRDGFRRRLTETPGIVTTQSASVDVNMRILEKKPDVEIPPVIEEMLAKLRKTWQRPDGEELTDGLAVSRCAHELAAGLYNRWEFPRGEPVELITKWLEIRKMWNKAVRSKLGRREAHMDSPYHAEAAAMRAWGDMKPDPRKPEWKTPLWPMWRDIKEQVKPVTVPQRVHNYLVLDAIKWADANLGILWYAINDFGDWVTQESDRRIPKHGGGPKALDALLKERGDRPIACSIKAHGTGRDGLQRLYCNQLVAQPSSTAQDWEQLLGRLHRQGQKREVTTLFYRHTPELASFTDQSIRRAQYVQGTLGSQQKIITYKMAPSEDEGFDFLSDFSGGLSLPPELRDQDL